MNHHRLRRTGQRWGWLVVPALIVSPFALSVVHPTTFFDTATDTEFCATWGAVPGDDRVQHDGNWFLVGEPTAHRAPCNGDDLWHYGGAIDGVDAVVWADCQVSWVDGRRSTAQAEGLDRCW